MEVCVCVCALTASQVKWVFTAIPLGYTGTNYGFSRTIVQHTAVHKTNIQMYNNSKLCKRLVG